MWKRAVILVSIGLTLLTTGGLTVATASPKPPAPKAWTTRASLQEIGAAWLNGAINPRGVPTAYHFEYGLTDSYGRTTSSMGTYDGNKRYPAEAPVYELRPGVTYHFRVVAVSRGGTAFGADRIFISKKSRPKLGAVIACYHEKAHRYTARVHPGRCTFRAYRGKQTVAIPIRGMRWGHWGVFATRAAFGVDMRDGERVRVVASRPVRCDDGSTWYSMVGGVFLKHVRGFQFHLPTCVEQ
jgi:hypothetical protein